MEQNKYVIIVSNHYEHIWDNHIKNDANKNRLSRNVLLSMELEFENRFVDMIDLLDYSPEAGGGIHGESLISRESITGLNGIFLSDFLLRQGYDVDLIRNFVSSKEKFKALLKNEPFAVIISTSFFDLSTSAEIVSFIRENDNGKSHIIIGGPTIYYAKTYYPQILEMYGKLLPRTFLIAEKKGEHSLIVLLRSLNVHDGKIERVIKEVNNVIAVDAGGDFVSSAVQEELTDINDHIIDWLHLPEKFLSPVVPVRTSIGCPFRCDFCTFWMLHPKIRYKKNENVTRELKDINDRGFVKHIMITDDTLNITEKSIKSFCKIFIDNDLSVGWSAFLRSGTMTEEIAQMLKDSNCEFVHIGFESFDDKILKNMNKNETSAEHFRCIEILKKADIDVIGSFIFGYPGETKDTVFDTVSAINRSGIDITEIYGFIYYPYSALSKKSETFQLTGQVYNWKHYSMSSRELYSEIFPQIIESLDSFGIHDWDNWGTIALLMAHGLTFSEIKDLFRIKHSLLKRQGSNGISAADLRNKFEPEMCRIDKLKERIKSRE